MLELFWGAAEPSADARARLSSALREAGIPKAGHRPFASDPDEAPHPEREQVRRTIGVLQALRLALLQHMFLKAVSIPVFSRANDISREDVLEMVFSLRVDDALAQLRRAFPVEFPSPKDFAMDAPADYPDAEAEGYAAIARDYIDPIERANSLMLRLTIAIANQFGAHG